MAPDDKIIFLDKARAEGRGSIQAVYDGLRQLALKRLPALFGNMLDHVDDALFERADKANDSEQQESYFATMRQVRLRRRELEEAFQRELLAAFRALSSAARRATELSGALELLDNDLLEQSIAVESMVGKTRARNMIPLGHLQMRLDHLLSHCQVDESNNPFDPQQIIDAFARASRVLELGIDAQLIVYKLFDKHLLGQLPGLYDEANRTLINVGVLPNLKDPTSAEREKKRPQPEERAESTPAEGGDQLFQALHELLVARKYGSDGPQWTGTGYSDGPPASVPDVVAALSALQRDAGHGTYLSDADLKALLGQALMRQSGHGQSIGQVEDDTIDIVEMLFDAILDEPNLPASIKALIARLQIPVLKVALLDKEFFSRKSHPARRLINELALAAIGWVEPVQVERDPLYRQIESIVDRVLSEFDDDVDLFQDLLDEFLEFWEEERKRSRLVEERTRQAAEGKAKVDGAKARVEEAIAERTSGRALPQVVHTVLEEAWAKVLFITCLKEGEDSEQWQRQLQVVDRLIWSLEPKPQASDRKELLQEIPGLLHDLREGLNGILFNPFEMTRLFKDLEAEHIRCLGMAGAAAAEVAEPAPVSEETVAEAAIEVAPEPVEEGADELAEFRDQLLQVNIGTWFEFSHASGNTVRAKLSARLRGGERMIFVNRAGFKLADKALNDLAEDLRRGRAVILDDNLLFDKALETVITNLRDLRAGQ